MLVNHFRSQAQVTHPSIKIQSHRRQGTRTKAAASETYGFSIFSLRRRMFIAVNNGKNTNPRQEDAIATHHMFTQLCGSLTHEQFLLTSLSLVMSSISMCCKAIVNLFAIIATSGISDYTTCSSVRINQGRSASVKSIKSRTSFLTQIHLMSSVRQS